MVGVTDNFIEFIRFDFYRNPNGFLLKSIGWGRYLHFIKNPPVLSIPYYI